ncbi:MAG TPA: nicotinamidase, partial [Pseudomonas sp.]|nr:nicotinamidase [Pseudomonas sp.]
MKIASFDVDAQKGFTPLCPNELPVPGGEQIAPALNQLASRASLRLGSKDAHSPQAAWVAPSHAEMLKPLPLANADLSWVSHCVPGTPGFELLDELPAPLDYDYFVWKGVEPDLHPYGACYHDLAEKRSTGAIEFL